MDYWQVLRRVAHGLLHRRKRLALLSFVLAAAVILPAAGYYVAKEPPRFATSATILLEVRPDRIPVFQEFSPLRPLSVQMAILHSRALAQGVIDSLPKGSLRDLIDHPYGVDYWLTLKNAYRRLTGGEPEVASPQEQALKELQTARVQFDARADGIVHIKTEASRAPVAVDLANAYIEVLLARTRSFNVDDARVSREFLDQQVADVKKTVQASEARLVAFTTSHGGVKIPERSQAAVTQLSQTEGALAEIEANRKMVEARVKGLRQKVQQQKQAAQDPGPAAANVETAPPEMTAAAEVKRLRVELTKLETNLLELRNKFTDEHPRVVLTKNRITEVRNQLAAAVKQSTPVTPAAAAVPAAERENFSEELLGLETALQSLIAQEDALREQAKTLRRGLNGLSHTESEYERLTREADRNRALYALLSDKLAGARIREQGEMKVVKVIDPPGPATMTTSERRLKLFVAALALACVAGIAVPVGVELRNKRVEDEDDVYAATELPVLALVPRMRTGRPRFAGRPAALSRRRRDSDYLFSDAFRTLRVALQLAARTDDLRTVLVMSASPGEGKSTIVLNLGYAFSESGLSVVIADTDFLRPTLHRTLKVSSTGLSEVLQANRPIEESLVRVRDGMWAAAPTQAVKPSALGTLGSARLKEMIRAMATKADLVVCDSAPLLLAPETLFLATAVDGVLLVTKAGAVGYRELARVKSMLDGVGARVLGVVLNEVSDSTIRREYRHGYERYYAHAARSEAK